ncbi:peptidoglycan DD-metalloendopeptidase family protein [Hoeflea poritis]|uniref:Peptidoglycan DD-metalloendopeptidase family protein n=1 Tax=Hoeflea poritis TaxID=2993659 RepID=A0ABT4VPP1_9HYPH|nr:peptidoglycan DD-metalloendopeptidase family protein [Hoeflea poritis]MDA4846661.1 peptidoglycan DD-metalloendopeptidase family protein [Hoeflea poritis]
MRIRLSAISSKTARRLAGAVCLASLAAGCSSEATRFDHGLFTGTVPEPVGSRNAGTATARAPAPAPAPGEPALAQPYPGDASAANTASTYDRTHTGSIAQTYPATSQQQPVYVAQPAVERKPLRSAPAIEPPVQDVRLAPVPVVSAKEPDLQRAPVTKKVEVPVARIPTPVPAPKQVASRAPASSNSLGTAPDPIITGTTPSSAAARNDVAGGWTTTGGTRVAIAPGETIYNLSRRYGVPAREIMKANKIADPSRVAAGQVVIIPTYVYSRTTPVSAPDNDPKTRAARASTGYQGEAQPDKVPLPKRAPDRQVAVLPKAPTPKPTTPEAAENKTIAASSSTAGTSATYTVQPGDSLSGIATRNGITVNALKAANGLSTATIRVGQTLIVPRANSRVDGVQTASVPANKGTAATVKSYAEETPAQAAAVATPTPKTTGIDKLRWPARGQIMSGFGAVDGGARNDGIDISLPKGTPVKAAENGVVIYAGTGLKEFGKTVLVRHGNGLVSVYGHASELIVERGDQVSRGQVVALSGMSGQATRPKLHFEIRKDAKPVDPLTYLE